MTQTLAGSFSSKAVAATLAAALTLTTAGVAPARADNKDAIVAAAFFGLIAAGIIASTRGSKAGTRHLPDVARPQYLPEQCRFDIRHGADRGTWYGRRCLSEHDVQVWSLPGRCERWVELPRRHLDVVAYSAQCLTRSGATAADRGRVVQGYTDNGHGYRSRGARD